MVSDQVKPLNEFLKQAHVHCSINLVLLIFIHGPPFIDQVIILVDDGFSCFHLKRVENFNGFDFMFNIFEKFKDFV